MTMSPATINLKCQNCGSPLVFGQGEDRAMCQHCRSQNLITVGTDGTITLSLVQKIDAIDNKTDQILALQKSTVEHAERKQKIASAKYLLRVTMDEHQAFLLREIHPRMTELKAIRGNMEYEQNENRLFSTRNVKILLFPSVWNENYEWDDYDWFESVKSVFIAAIIIAIVPTLLVATSASASTVVVVFFTVFLAFIIAVSLVLNLLALPFLPFRLIDRAKRSLKLKKMQKELEIIQKEMDDLTPKKMVFEEKIAALKNTISTGD